MPMSDYVRALRAKIGTDLLLVPSAHVAIRDDDGRILLVRHVEGRWQLPGGAIEPYEDPRDAAARECMEEAGVTVRIGNVIDVFGGEGFGTTYPNGDRIGFVTILFDGQPVAGTPRPDHVETQDVGWFALEDTDALEMHAATRAMIRGSSRPARA